MNPQREALLLRRTALVARSAALRERLGAHGKALQPAMRLADSALSAGRWIKGHPYHVMGALLAVSLLKPRSAWRWGSGLWGAWRFVRPMLRVWLSRRSR